MDPFLGTIKLFPLDFEPQGWMLCNGRQLTITQHQALYALIGNRYGGDGRTNFNLPNLTGAEPFPGMKYYIAYIGLFPTRD